ncbi:MAG: DEAD/DEAH box helicase family protein [Bacteroidales bacterium]|nr:DEAD/DEAH box helicase family protein [Bacteroidales bacterium]
MNIKPIDFQYKAIAQLREATNQLWSAEGRPQIILHSPTGSGKTLMTCAFIDSLQDPSPEDVDLGDVAFFWITLNNELAMQSKDKFFKYFAPNLRNTLSTFDDCADTLRQNEILFVNWQKISQKRGKDRLLLRLPTNEAMHKESGFYFEELMKNTHNAGRKIIMVIDESHSNVGTELSQEIIDYVDPKLILKVSATPFKDKTAENAFLAECFYHKAAIVAVDEADVVAAGLIKEEIVGQTAEDLSRFEGGDIDNTMLALAKQKRDDLKKRMAKARL